VLGHRYAAGPSGADLFELPVVATNTALLLCRSITYGFVLVQCSGAHAGVMAWWLYGLLGLRLPEPESPSSRMISKAPGPQRSAFRSSFSRSWHARAARGCWHIWCHAGGLRSAGWVIPETEPGGLLCCRCVRHFH